MTVFSGMSDEEKNIWFSRPKNIWIIYIDVNAIYELFIGKEVDYTRAIKNRLKNNINKINKVLWYI